MDNAPTSRRARLRLTILLIVYLCLSSITVANADEPLVFAAASLKNALDEVIVPFQDEHDIVVRVSYSSSGTLARQIENGAPAQLFISANPLWMDYLQQRDLIDANTRIDLLGNNLVLISADSSIATVEITPDFDLAALLGDQRLAIGDPGHVPAGIYAKAALENLDLWQSVAGNIAQADNVRTTLALVARQEAPLGIVYGSDALVESSVHVLAEFPPDSHPPIVYPAALIAGYSGHTEAVALLTFLQSAEAGAIFSRYGFRRLD